MVTKMVTNFQATQIVTYESVQKILREMDVLKRKNIVNPETRLTFEITKDCVPGEISCTLNALSLKDLNLLVSKFFEQ